MKPQRYEVRASMGSVARTALRFASLAEAESTYSKWAESRCYGNDVQLIDHRKPKNWLLKSSAK